jgi:crotonobetainyl-CoA:carnitine CoA-transferase CaiB-like acyl-CoA transferase
MAIDENGAGRVVEGIPSGGLLNNLRVLDLGQGVSGPFCARLLADQGAAVIKVEPPEGDPARRMGPFAGDEPHGEKSIPFLYLNTNKRSITLNLSTAAGRTLLHALVRWADVLVENFEPRLRSSLGLDDESLREVNPRLVVTSITSFGSNGPYCDWKATDLVTSAVSGLMYHSGDADKEPLRSALSQSLYVAGINGASATLVALYHRLSSGLGGRVDVSVAECMTAHLVQSSASYAYTGGLKGRRPERGTPLEELMPCQDGHVVVSAQGSQPFAAVADLLGVEELKGPEFATAEGRIVNGEALERLILEGLARWKKKDLFHAANKQRLVFGMAQGPDDLYRCPHLRERKFFVSVHHPVAGDAEYPCDSIRLSEGSFGARSPAPLLGAHNTDVYQGIVGLSEAEIVRLRNLAVI